MNKVYLIIQKDFDNLENKNPEMYDIVGYADTIEHATAIVKANICAKIQGLGFRLE